MAQFALVPLLTEKDPVESGEGGIDPLGTDALADALAVRLAPGVRERQRHPRFLTALSVSLEACREFDEETVAADGVSEPWTVFEWYLVEGLVLRIKDPKQRRGLPGGQKAARAIADGVPLSAKRYLKSPAIFGFHGVYRVLARTLGVQEGDHLGEAGLELLSIWAKEQGLDGFAGTGDGPGLAVRSQLEQAVREGLDKGATARSDAWRGWQFFGEHLAPYSAGPKEAVFISARLLDDPRGFRRELIEFLISTEGRRAWEAGESERDFHLALKAAARDELRQLLDAIDAYETFSCSCHDAFQDCLCEMTCHGGSKTSVRELAALRPVVNAAECVPSLFAEVMEKLEPMGEAARFRDTFAGLSERGGAVDWVERLLEHHRKTQRQKPPQGKNPWFERFDDGGFIIRPDYRTDDRALGNARYVHLYRTRSLWQFALDLYLAKP